MANLRTPPVTVDNAEFWLEVGNPMPYYFVGDKPKFSLCARQLSGRSFSSKLQVRWDLLRVAGSTVHIADLSRPKLPVDDVWRKDLDVEWLHLAGTALYTLEFSGVPGTSGGHTVYDVRHPAASYEVFDRGVYEDGQKLGRRTFSAFIGSVVASAFLGAATLVLTLVILGVLK